MKYIIDAIPPSNNKFKGRQNHWEYRELKKQWELLVYCKCRPIPRKPFENVLVKITYFFPTKIRHDPDNYNGVFILDGKHDKNNPRTEIEIIGR